MIAVSLFIHAMGKMLGQQNASQLLGAMISRGPGSDRFPAPECVRTVHGLERTHQAERVRCYVDCSERDEGLARSRAFHWAAGFLAEHPDCRVWVTCDDDVQADDVALKAAVKHASSVTWPRIVVVPCAIPSTAKESPILSAAGGAQTMAGEANVILVHETHAIDPELQQISSAGLGLAVFNRPAVERIKWACGELAYQDRDGAIRLAVFLDVYLKGNPGEWLSGDESFFHRLPADVECVALCVGETRCSGVPLDLRQVKQQ